LNSSWRGDPTKCSPRNQPKLGWQVDSDSLDEYIDLADLSVTELRKTVRTLRSELESAKAELEAEKAKPRKYVTHQYNNCVFLICLHQQS
jgi:uncharacterized small protein (DUF1192 family)